jgi:hypothetical protein
MTISRLLLATGTLVTMFASAAPAVAQGRTGVTTGHAVPRAPAARVVSPRVVGVVPYRPYFYGPGISLGFYYGYPYYYGAYPYAYGYPWYGYPPYGYYPPYAYGVGLYGGVRLDIPEKNAEVYADGYFVGTVGDFDGTFQQLTLQPGPHRIEVRADGFESIAFDVNVEPGRTIKYRAALRPQQS